MAAYTWSVFIPGADLPESIETDYLLADGEEIEAGGRIWIVERVEFADDRAPDGMRAYVVAPTEP